MVMKVHLDRVCIQTIIIKCVNDKVYFSKLRPLLMHIRDTSMYKYNNNYNEIKGRNNDDKNK